MWRNWAGDQSCAPLAIERPGSVAEIGAALERAAAAGRTVRVTGSGHSFSDVVVTDGTLIDLGRMRRVVDVDREAGRVRIEGGVTIDSLSGALAAHGLALANLGDIDVQTVAGAISTATHGTGGRLGNLSSQVEAIDLVGADGGLHSLSRRSDAEAFRAARVGVGALGVIARLTLRCVPAFTLRGVDAPRPLEETLDRLDELVESNDHFEFFAFPYTGTALTRANNRLEGAPRPPHPARAYAEDVMLSNGILALIMRAGRRRPALIPRLNRLIMRLAGTRVRTDRSDRVFATPRLVRFTEMEYAVPRTATAAAVRSVLALVEERGLPVNFPVEVRFVASDDAFLSPASGRDTGYVAVHSFEGMAWEGFFREVEGIMDGHDGRPHWGKRHFQTAATLRPRYPEWDRFQAVRARLDPEGRFTSPAIERVLGAVRTGAGTGVAA
jgi:L-gulono-1,4-lactone dehydrogenase